MGLLLGLVVCTGLQSAARAGEWFDPNWSFRRVLDVTWDAEHQGDDGEIAVADFYTAGRCLPDGSDLRVVSDDGRPCATRLLRMGPGDHVELLFKLIKFQRKYAIYFGNPHPSPLPQNVSGDVPIRFGLLMEVRGLADGNGEGPRHLQQAWDKGSPDYGAAMIDRPFIGYDPVTNSGHTIARLTGSLFAPLDGDYKIAGACADRGSILIDGKPVLFIQGCPADIRFNATIHLARGRHDFTMYHLSYGSEFIISVGWKPPDAQKVQIINRENFGICARGRPGPLQEIKKDLTADFDVQNVAECFEHDPSTREPERGNYSQLLRFTAGSVPAGSNLQIDWDFGDGQGAKGQAIDHVFLTPGVYPVRIEYRINSTVVDTQTNRILVERDLTHPQEPQTNDPPVQSKIVATYDVSQLPVGALPWATILHEKAGDKQAMLATAQRLAAEPRHGDSNLAFSTLQDAAQTPGIDAHDRAAIWSAVPVRSDLQPRAVRMLTNVQLWELADFDAARQALEPFASGADPGVARRYAQLLLLLGNSAEAKKRLAAQTPLDDTGRSAAISGAMARTVEYYITESNPAAGDEAWERWMSRFPGDFLEGYSVLLRVQLMNLDGHPQAAAAVAEAFAHAMPRSSYAPALLDKASKLLARLDPAKSAQLHEQLKQRYPEDPLSQ